WRGYSGALALFAISTGVAALMQRRFDLSNLIMVYLVGVVLSAIAFGRRAAMLAALLSVAAFDFLFVPPRYTLRVSDTQYLVTLGVMLFVAAVIGTLTAWLRGQLVEARLRSGPTTRARSSGSTPSRARIRSTSRSRRPAACSACSRSAPPTRGHSRIRSACSSLARSPARPRSRSSAAGSVTRRRRPAPRP